MKLLIIFLVSFCMSSHLNAQNCQQTISICESLLSENGGEFISDGQVYTAFLDREKAEFKTTFYLNAQNCQQTISICESLLNDVLWWFNLPHSGKCWR